MDNSVPAILTLEDIIRIIKRSKIKIAILAIIIMVGVLLIMYLRPPSYQSKTALKIGVINGEYIENPAVFANSMASQYTSAETQVDILYKDDAQNINIINIAVISPDKKKADELLNLIVDETLTTHDQIYQDFVNIEQARLQQLQDQLTETEQSITSYESLLVNSTDPNSILIYSLQLSAAQNLKISLEAQIYQLERAALDTNTYQTEQITEIETSQTFALNSIVVLMLSAILGLSFSLAIIVSIEFLKAI